MDLNLQDKNALVCGSSAGIGKAIAIELALLGANITLVSRSVDKMILVLEGLDTSKGQEHRFLAADFNDSRTLKTLVEAHVQEHPMHILINNTGGPPGGPVHSASVEAFVQAFHNHLICNQILTQALLPGMKTAGYGRIINVISTSVKQPLTNLGVSNTIRGAVANWAKTLANEVGAFGITVNNILPGATNTDRLKSIIQNKANRQNLPEEEVAEKMRSIIPVARFGDPKEIAAAAAFLASPAASYVTGINMPVDGGRTKCL